MIAICLLVSLPDANDSFDLIELNHVYDSNGKHILDQYIGWQCVDGKFRCEFWCFQNRFTFPTRDLARGGWLMVGRKTTEGVRPRLVRSRHFHETWLQFDPEVENRDVFPQSKRRGLAIRKR